MAVLATSASLRSSRRRLAAAGEPHPTGRIHSLHAPAVLARAVTSLRLRARDWATAPSAAPIAWCRRGACAGSRATATSSPPAQSSGPCGIPTAGCAAESRVLDVGCGIGRLAHTLTAILDPAAGGAYLGFDPVAPAIAWCAERYPAHFRFVHADLRNDLYNPAGAVTATDYRFPVPDGWATLAVATSVFTHLDRAAVEHYLAETGRARAADGVALLTFFLLDEGSRAALAAGRARQAFVEPAGEQAIAEPRGDHGRGRPRSRTASSMRSRGLGVRGRGRPRRDVARRRGRQLPGSRRRADAGLSVPPQRAAEGADRADDQPVLGNALDGVVGVVALLRQADRQVQDGHRHQEHGRRPPARGCGPTRRATARGRSADRAPRRRAGRRRSRVRARRRGPPASAATQAARRGRARRPAARGSRAPRAGGAARAGPAARGRQRAR